MGLFSSSRSSRSTTNNDNRTINDFHNADLSQDIDNSVRVDIDNSVQQEIDNSVQQEIDNSIQQEIDNSITGQYAGNSGNITVLDGGVIDLAAQISSDNAGLMSENLGFLDSAHRANLSSAISLHNTGFQQLQLGTGLANDLVSTTTNFAFEAQRDNNAALVTGFENAMQFVEDFSRSDGAAVAETNMKTIGIIALAAVVTTFIFKQG